MADHAGRSGRISNRPPGAGRAESADGRDRPGGAWLAEHEMHKRKARAANFDVVFIGDSITERWRYPAEGKLVWDKKIAPLNAGEFGISGDGTQSVLWRLQDGELADLHPKVVVLLIGTNHIQSSPPGQIVEGIT